MKTKLPYIAGYRSIKQFMQPGIYNFCTCGLSSNQPFCDDSHRGTDFTPLKVVIEEAKRVSWCACKYSKTLPFCDHAHRDLIKPEGVE
ncbi:MAG: CDGSH iron-sulfur domain-containing protein [Bacteroidetes bacterium]|nr:CDGSH iron-sulfur domain-containing protein [Bacteroidota bacterium]